MAEEQPQVFRVGQVVRDWQSRLRLFGAAGETNLATPAVIERVLDELDALTRELEAKDATRRTALFLPICDATCVDLMRWRIRLDDYRALVAEAAPDDRKAIVWSVTGPLFLGWYGGRTGDEVEMPEGGVPSTFDVEVQHPADIGTPYSLANQLAVATEWEDRRQALLVDDFWDEAAGAAARAAGGAGAVISEAGVWPWLVGAGVAVTATATAVGVAAYRAGRLRGE